MARHSKHISGLTTFVIVLLILAVLAATAYVIWLCIDIVNQPISPSTVSEKIELPVPTTETTTVPTTISTVPPEVPPVGQLLHNSPSGYVCIGLRPTERSAEDRYFYAVLPDQDAAISAIEAAEATQTEGVASNGEAATGLMVEYQNGLWWFTESGAMFTLDARIEAADAAPIYALCMDAAQDFGFQTALVPGDIHDLTSATMTFNDQTVTITDSDSLRKLEGWLGNSDRILSAACWFTAFLTMERANGETLSIAIATDSCTAWLTEGIAFDYAASQEDLFGLFSMPAPE